jgi:hypothetical protein
MNGRIKELSKKAANYANTYDDAGADIWFEMYNQKFAELLIKECIECGNNLANHYINNYSEQEHTFLLAAIADYSNEIEKHFGVKK